MVLQTLNLMILDSSKCTSVPPPPTALFVFGPGVPIRDVSKNVQAHACGSVVVVVVDVRVALLLCCLYLVDSLLPVGLGTPI